MSVDTNITARQLEVQYYSAAPTVDSDLVLEAA